MELSNNLRKGGTMAIKIYLFLVFIFLQAVSVRAEEVTIKSTSSDRTNMEVTIYNNNLGLIKDTRNIRLPKGLGQLRFMDVASHIKPVTVHVKSVNNPDALTILEQNYEYDLINEKKLLDKYVGKKIKIIDRNRFQDKKEELEALLVSNNNGQVYKINDEIYLGHSGHKILPEIPENLIAKPTLMWLYENKSDKKHHLQTSYLTTNIYWKADYIVVLNKDDSEADISGWVSIDNKSGVTYNNARLKLVAGKTNTIAQRPPLRAMKGMMQAEAAAPYFEEKEFFEYHIYDLQRKTTIKDNQSKQINLLEAHSVKIEKEFITHSAGSRFTRRHNESERSQPVDVYIAFSNSKDNNLGSPLPEGIMRLYKKDSDESLQFIGEDRVEHTPTDEEVKLKTGLAFDVKAVRTQKEYKKITSGLFETAWEIEIRNHKKENITVTVIESLQGDWEVLNSSHPYGKTDAFTIRFIIEVPEKGKAMVAYQVKTDLR